MRRRYPTEALVFDTETETGPAQRLRFLVWRVYRDPVGHAPGHFCVEEGIAYPDDLPDRDPKGFRVLQRQAQRLRAEVAPGFGASATRGGLMFEPLSWWLDQRLYRYGYKHRNRCYVVGFNLPFDFGRLASYWTGARKYYRGGWSLGIWGAYNAKSEWHDTRYRPRLLMKAIDPRRTLFGWGSVKKADADEKGAAARFIDLRTLAFALTDVSHTLESACTAFGDHYEKTEVDYDQITPELVRYALDDVRHTGLLYRNTLAELARHEGVDLQPHRLFSPATVGARYLEAIGLKRPLVKFTSLTDAQLGWDTRAGADAKHTGAGIGDELLGYAMSAFYGGRAEARIVRTAVPVVHTDATSMYPLVNALLDTWHLLRADRLTEEDVTEDVRGLLAASALLDRCLTRELWTRVGVTLVELEPDNDILPVRATYQPDNDQDFGIGVNPLTYHGTLWYAFPDVIAATILGGDKPPRVVRAIRLHADHVQPGLRPIALRGGTSLDPHSDRDPFLVMIEERARVKADPELSEPERDRLELFLKITANATAYGSLARFDRRDLDTAIPVSVHGPDPDPRTETIKTPEDPGPFCFPPVACTITAGARLMLAILERLVTDAGGTYAFCDTDSMAIIATPDGGDVPCATEHGDAVNALSYNTVRSILDSFKRLSPYDPALLEPWKVEHDSLDRQLYCYAISAKRYALYRTDPHGEPELVSVHDGEDEPDDERTEAIEPLTDWSEHGLGLYLDPLPRINGRPQLDQRRRRLWMRQAWQSILADAHGAPTDPPSWTDQYALARFTLSRPTLADWFSGYDKSRPREERVRPGSFGLLAHPNTLIHGPHPQRLPAAPYETAAGLWPTLPWFDRATGDPLIVITGAARRQSDRFAQQLTDGAVVVDTLGEILGRYTRRPEHKSLAPNREPAGHETAGLLARRPLTSTPAKTRLIGKEGTKLLERLTGPQLDRVNERDDYGTRTDPWATLIHPVLRDAGAAILIAHGIPRSTAFATLRGATRPRQHYDLYLQAVSAHARACLAAWGLPAAGDPLGQLAQYVRERDRRGENVRRCEWCGEPLPAAARADARYHGDACRQAARRGRANRSD